MRRHTPLPPALRLARAALATGAALGTFALSALPTSGATSDALRSAVTLGVLVAGSAFSVVALSRRRRAGWAAAVGVGLLAAAQLVRAGPVLWSQLRLPNATPEQLLGAALGVGILLAPVAALLCCLGVRGWRAVLH